MGAKRRFFNPTDHLANERTFLAYVRTSLSLLAFGFVIDRFALLARYVPSTVAAAATFHVGSRRLGLTFAIFGCALATFGSWRYAVVEQALIKDDYRPLFGMAIFVGGATVIIGALVIASLMRIL